MGLNGFIGEKRRENAVANCTGTVSTVRNEFALFSHLADEIRKSQRIRKNNFLYEFTFSVSERSANDRIRKKSIENLAPNFAYIPLYSI